MGYHKDFREYLDTLEANNKLVRIKREINKDTEAMPLVRCQFRGLPEEERKVFFFENVVDVKEKKYNIPLVVGAHDCNIPGILDVAFHEESGSSGCCVIQMRKTHPAQPWQALNAAVSLAPNVGKIIIAVDEDIDPRGWDSVVWAMCWRMQANRDVRVSPGKNATMDYSVSPLTKVRTWREYELGSVLLVDATLKWDYPPVSLPKSGPKRMKKRLNWLSKENTIRRERSWPNIG